MITLRQIIRNQGVTNKVIADALGIESTNIGRYDDLSKRRLSKLIVYLHYQIKLIQRNED